MAHFENQAQPLTQEELEQQMIDQYHWVGALATGVLVITTCPISTVQSVLQTQAVNPYLTQARLKFKGFSDCQDFLSKGNGFGSLFNGAWIGTIAGATYYYREHFLLKMENKGIIPGKKSKKSLKGCLKYYLGTVSLYTAFAVVQFPLGVIIARMFNDIEPVPKYKNMFSLISQVYQEGGFYKGFEWCLFDVLIEGVFRTLHHYFETDVPETEKWKYYAIEYSMEVFKYPVCTMCVREQAGFDAIAEGEGLKGLYGAFSLQLIVTNCTLLWTVGSSLWGMYQKDDGAMGGVGQVRN